MNKIMRRRNKKTRRNSRNRWRNGGRGQFSAPPEHDWAQPEHEDAAAEEEKKKAAAKKKIQKHVADRDAWGERHQCKCCGANYKATFYYQGFNGVPNSPVCYHCRQGIPKQVTVRAGAPSRRTHELGCSLSESFIVISVLCASCVLNSQHTHAHRMSLSASVAGAYKLQQTRNASERPSPKGRT